VHHWGDLGPQQFDGPAGVLAAQSPLDGYDYSLTLTLPPLAVLWLKREKAVSFQLLAAC
jgi:hypothetical protein